MQDPKETHSIAATQSVGMTSGVLQGRISEHQFSKDSLVTQTRQIRLDRLLDTPSAWADKTQSSGSTWVLAAPSLACHQPKPTNVLRLVNTVADFPAPYLSSTHLW